MKSGEAIFQITVPMQIKGLQSLLGQLKKLSIHADQKKYDPSVVLQSRLAPDQFPLMRQIQITCDTAKLAAQRITGRDGISFLDDEKNLTDIRYRIEKTIEFLQSFSSQDYQGKEEKLITTPRWDGKSLIAMDYCLHHVIPNFYFHLTTAYAILRHNGVDLGKADYLGELPFLKPV
ncbi:MAG: DUF1993 domain-containing protein [Bdellovibrio sp.]